jgi:microsomal dipeptidase-like Zn-dependent dipeptidase
LVSIRYEKRVNTYYPSVRTVESGEWPNITRGLVSRGYKDDEIKGIIGDNFLRIFKEVVG